MTLEAIPLLQSLPQAELEALRQIAQERAFPTGGEIFQEGAPGDGVYFVRSGLVEIYSGKTERRIFSRLGPGEIFGEMAIIEHQPRSAAAVAAVDTEVYFLPREELLPFIQRSPCIAFALLQQISHRLREFNRLHLRELVQAETLAVIGRFAQSIVHDLKNPLNIIGLSSEMSGWPSATPEVRAKAQKAISKQVERINDMVSDILIFTQNTRGDAEFKPCDYHEFILGLVDDLQAEVKLKSVKVELKNNPPAVTVLSNRRRLERVLFNLAHNAVDAMPNGGEIFLRFQSDGKEVVTEVEDTGPGIAPEIADKLFQPFATHGKTRGTGLGLSICKKIVEDHGGKISARSEPGRGAIFAFTLPLAK